MAFSASEINYLQRFVFDQPAERNAGVLATYFSEHYGIGRISGRRVLYTPKDHISADKLLESHGLPLLPLGPDALRQTAAAFAGMSEKVQTLSPHADLVAVKAIGQCTVDGCSLVAPNGGFLSLPLEVAAYALCKQVLMVENFETFRWLDNYPWLFELPELREPTMVIYRGDNILKTSVASALLRARLDPVYAFYDFDPAGLGMAHALPRLKSVIVPDEAWLKTVARSPRGQELFDRSVRQYESTLDLCENASILFAWNRMKSWTGGVAQEAMTTATAPQRVAT